MFEDSIFGKKDKTDKRQKKKYIQSRYHQWNSLIMAYESGKGFRHQNTFIENRKRVRFEKKPQKNELSFYFNKTSIKEKVLPKIHIITSYHG